MKCGHSLVLSRKLHSLEELEFWDATRKPFQIPSYSPKFKTTQMNKPLWVDLHREAVGKLLSFRDKQDELISLLLEMRDAGLKVTPINDQNPKGHIIPLSEIDPFTFLATFNRAITIENRLALWRFLKKRWNLQAELPESFIGIPVANNQKSWWIPYSYLRDPKQVPRLWDLAEQAYHDGPEELDGELYEECLALRGIGLAYLTMGLFWVNPEKFLSLDAVNLGFLEAEYGIVGKPKTYPGYLAIFQKFQSQVRDSIPAFSAKAYEWTWEEEDEPKPILKEDTVLYENPKANKPHRWVIAPGEQARLWKNFQAESIAAIGWDFTGDLASYSNREELRECLVEEYEEDKSFKNNTLALWEFGSEIKPGDFIYVKKGRQRIIGFGKVTGDYSFDSDREEYKHTIGVKWLSSEEIELPQDRMVGTKTLTNIDNYSWLIDYLDSFYEQGKKPIPVVDSYPREDALRDLFMSEKQFDQITTRLTQKKNIILEGPPGVGKTFVARRLAYYLMKEKNNNRCRMVQFHQSYSYEDFVQGFRPKSDGGFELRDGIFHKLCREAADEPDRDYFLVIDEINRGNLSKIFGEMMMGIEHDKRGESFAIQLTYSQDAEDTFHVPDNLHLIGTMNTADRSLSMVDYALRRRFSFFTLQPEFSSPQFHSALEKSGCAKALLEHIETRLNALNQTIIEDTRDLGRGYRIGHSFFCPSGKQTPDATWLNDIIDFEVAPLLREYWIDRPGHADTEIEKLRFKS